MEPRLERFIGVIYRPETERWSHYAEAILPRQFDAWVWFDETEAVSPLAGCVRTRRGRYVAVRPLTSGVIPAELMRPPCPPDRAADVRGTSAPHQWDP